MADSTRTPGDSNDGGGRARVEGRFAMIPEALLLDPEVSASAVRVYGVLLRFGTNPDDCFPSYAKIASAVGASARSVPAWVRELETAGWVTRHPSPDGTSNGYTVRTHREGPTASTPARPDAPTPRPGTRGVRAGERGGGALESAPKESQGTRAKNETPCSPPGQVSLLPVKGAAPAARTYASGRGHDLTFNAFWTAFPRKVGKGAARKAWAAAVRRAPDHVIVAGAERYRDDPNREPEFTCHPTTWLNQDRWDDEPLPARSGRRDANRTERALSRMAGGRPVPPLDLGAVYGTPAARAIGS